MRYDLRKYLPYFLFVLFLIILGISKFYHEPWRDEFHSLCISLAAKNPLDLYYLREYEGHPYLYYFILYLTQIFGKSYFAFLAVHYLAAATAMFFLLFRFRLHWFIQCLLPFNYYFLFEFGTLNRQYIFIFLFLILSSFNFIKEKPNWVFSFIFLFLAAHLQVQTLPICFSIGLYYVYNLYRRKVFSITKALFVLAILSLIIFLSFYSSIPPHDCYNLVLNYIPHFAEDYLFVLKKMNYGTLTLFDWNQFHFWNTTLFQNGLPHVLIFFLFIVGSTLVLKKDQRIFYFIALVGIVYMLFIINTWGFRHFSFTWITFFIFYLLGQNYHSKWNIIFISLFLVPQSISGSIATYRDIKYVFSNCSSTAKVVAQLSSKVPVSGYLNFTLDGITYLSNYPIHYLGSGALQTFTKFKAGCDAGIETNERLMESITNYLKIYHAGYFLIHLTDGTHEVRKNLLMSKRFRVKQIYKSPNESIVFDENYVIFEIEENN